MLKIFVLALSLLSLSVCGQAQEPAGPIVIGEAFSVDSESLQETRTVNVFMPTRYGDAVERPLPVLYMLDGGIDEDFLHIAGLLQVMVSNGSIRPLMLVGIENTERARDMTGPSDDERDHEMAARIGGAAAFRRFFADELIPWVEARFEVTSERAIIGESLAGLFVIDTLAQAPSLFETYIAADPSVWWNQYALNDSIAEALEAEAADGRRLFIAYGREAGGADRFQRFIGQLEASESDVEVIASSMPDRLHSNLFHPAALEALTVLFPAEDPQ
jgi:predicted alpha/beta superfamily hydrolase